MQWARGEGTLRERLEESWRREWKEWYVDLRGLKDDFLAGTAVALAQVPEAVAFALVVGLNPLRGLFATFIVGLVASVIGGRPGMISGASGSVAVVQVALKRDYGEEQLYFAVILMGIYQMFIGFSGVTKFAKMIPASVSFGFLNGLAIVIGIAQLGSFQDSDDTYVTGQKAFLTALLCIIAFAVTMLLPYLTTFIPSSLVAIIVSTFIDQVFGLDTKTVGDIGKMKGEMPPFRVPDMDYTGDAFIRCLMSGVIYGSVGLVESVMTLQVLDDLTETEGSQSREAFAQGLGNFIAGWVSTMGGSPMCGQSVINVSGGGKRRLSGTWASVLLLVIILAASPMIEMVPTGGLAGVMFSVVAKTFQWETVMMVLMRRIPFSTDGFVIILVTVTTVVLNLAMAVAIGVSYSALCFAWNMRNKIEITHESKADSWGNKTKIFKVRGRLFFGSARDFLDTFRDYHHDPVDVVLDLAECDIHDFSAIDAINRVAEKYALHDRRLHVKNINPLYVKLWERAESVLCSVVDDSTFERDHYVVGYEPDPISYKPEETMCDSCGKVIEKNRIRFGRVIRNYEFDFNTTVWYHFEVDGSSSCVEGHRIVGKTGGLVRGLNTLKRKDKKRVIAKLKHLSAKLAPENVIGPHHISLPRSSSRKKVKGGAKDNGEYVYEYYEYSDEDADELAVNEDDIVPSVADIASPPGAVISSGIVGTGSLRHLHGTESDAHSHSALIDHRASGGSMHAQGGPSSQLVTSHHHHPYHHHPHGSLDRRASGASSSRRRGSGNDVKVRRRRRSRHSEGKRGSPQHHRRNVPDYHEEHIKVEQMHFPHVEGADGVNVTEMMNNNYNYNNNNSNNTGNTDNTGNNSNNNFSQQINNGVPTVPTASAIDRRALANPASSPFVQHQPSNVPMHVSPADNVNDDSDNSNDDEDFQSVLDDE